MENKFKEFWINKDFGIHEVGDAFYCGSKTGPEQLNHTHVVEYAALQACEASLESANVEISALKELVSKNNCMPFDAYYKTCEVINGQLELENKKLTDEIGKLEEKIYHLECESQDTFNIIRARGEENAKLRAALEPFSRKNIEAAFNYCWENKTSLHPSIQYGWPMLLDDKGLMVIKFGKAVETLEALEKLK